MLLYLIRHGEPDYKEDALTETGWKQAHLVAGRLVESGVDEIHSSPMGRARETARPTAERLGLPVQVEPWAYELGSEGATTFPDGVSKRISSLPPAYFQQEAFRKYGFDEDLARIPALDNGELPARCRMLIEGFDAMLAGLGYRRNAAGTYDVVAPHDRHVVFFCHVAMQRVLLGRALNLPFHFTASGFVAHFTGITILEFGPGGAEKTVSPALISYGDVGHLYRRSGGPLTHYGSGQSF